LTEGRLAENEERVSNPIDEWLEGLRSELHARRTESIQCLQEIGAALARYEQAKSADLVRRFAEEHRLRVPREKLPSPLEAAQLLLKSVQALPELRGISPAQPSAAPAAEVPNQASRSASHKSQPEAAGVVAPLQAGSTPLPRLEAALRGGPLVIVGGINQREKLLPLPPSLRSHVEWVETSRQGTHAIGNLAIRIKQRRLAAVILLEGSLGHKHSDPLIAAAREARVPAAYAGKGSQASLLRAVLQLERMLPALEEMPVAGNTGAPRS
jgi:hypothetical protein